MIYAKFYNVNFMYAVEYSFEEKSKIDIQEVVGRISILKELKVDKENTKAKGEVKGFINSNI